MWWSTIIPAVFLFVGIGMIVAGVVAIRSGPKWLRANQREVKAVVRPTHQKGVARRRVKAGIGRRH